MTNVKIWSDILELFSSSEGSEITDFLFADSYIADTSDHIVTVVVDTFLLSQISDIQSETYLTLNRCVQFKFPDYKLSIVEEYVKTENLIDEQFYNFDHPVVSEEIPIEQKLQEDVPKRDFSYTDSNLSRDQLFSNFFYSHESIAVIKSARLIIESVRNKGYSDFSPLFLHGNSGIGKTHIVNAIGNELYKDNPKLNILYNTATEFRKQYLKIFNGGLDSSLLDNFKSRYESLDVFIIDDIQILQTQEGTLNEFFTIFETLNNANKLIIITSDVHPKELVIKDRLLTRFLSGIELRMSNPDSEIKRQIFNYFLESNNIEVEIEPKAIDVFIENTNSVRELKGYMNKLMVHVICSELGQIFTQADAFSLIDTKEVSPNMLTASDVLDTVAYYFDMQVSDIKSKKRQQLIVKARKLTIILLKERINMTHVRIAQELGYKDHTNVSKVCKVSEKLKQEYAEEYSGIARLLNKKHS